jgi:hypothetical protein
MPAAVIPQRMAASFLMIIRPGLQAAQRGPSLKTSDFANDPSDHFFGPLRRTASSNLPEERGGGNNNI